MANRVLLFDDIDVSEYFGTWQEGANARINAVSVPKRHGALVSDAVVQDVRQIQITGTLLSPDDTALGLRTVLDTLGELFSRLGKRLQLWDDRYITAYKSSFAWKYIEGSGLKAADYQLNFTCPDPFWHYIDTNAIATSLASMTALDITSRIYRKTFTLTNNGTFVAYPTYTFTMSDPCSKIVLYNLTLGRQFTFDESILAGRILEVDTSFFTVTNDGTEDLINWSGDFVWLLKGANSMQLDITFSSAPSFANSLLSEWTDRNY